KKGCIPGKNIPILSFHMGCLGDSHREIPDSGRLVARIGAWRWGPGPWDSWEICPLQIMTHNLWKTALVRLCLGFAALMVGTSAVRSQTYYYYPSTVASTSVTTAGATSASVYYYAPATYQN